MLMLKILMVVIIAWLKFVKNVKAFEVLILVLNFLANCAGFRKKKVWGRMGKGGGVSEDSFCFGFKV